MRTNRFTRILFATGLPLSAAAVFAFASPPPVSKKVVETPTKNVVANTAPTQVFPPIPRSKNEVEAPAKDAVSRSTPATPTADNPTVETGLVKWHKSLEEAQAAAAKSNKPVLLFQMMGYLDKKFC